MRRFKRPLLRPFRDNLSTFFFSAVATVDFFSFLPAGEPAAEDLLALRFFDFGDLLAAFGDFFAVFGFLGVPFDSLAFLTYQNQEANFVTIIQYKVN